ncbi:MFS transporter [Streptomyces cacaoi]|uniref:MFS transporter n=1 Tax=Streptomyces cacaoi TaxID=1898 RepID=UPI001FD49371|nr:MFS transporter [Streptomyces cacaoi]
MTAAPGDASGRGATGPAHRAHPAGPPAAAPRPATGTGRPGTPAPGAADAPPPGGRQPAFGARLMTPLLLGSVLNPVNSTMIATALVAIGRHFGVGAADTAWLVASLYLASAVAQPAMGGLADRFGPRRVFQAGLLIVVAAGAVGALAPAFGWLIASRVLLGVGTSAAYPCAMALLRTEAARLGRPVPRPVLARLSLASLGSAATGPVLGGLLAATVGWRAIFAVNIPVALLGLLLAALWLPRRPEAPAPDASGTRSAPQRTDVLGILLFAAALVTLMLFLMEPGRARLPLLAPFAVLGCAFVLQQLRHPAPFLDLRLLARHRPLLRTYLRHGLAYLVIYCVMYGFAQWLEESHGFSSLHSGLFMLPMSVTAGVCSLLGARTKGIRGPLTLAAALLVAGSGVLLLTTGSSPAAVLLAVAVVFGVSQGLTGTGNQAALAAQAPAGGVGGAAGLQRTSQYLGAIVASSLIAVFYGHSADDSGLHLIAVTTAGLGVLLLALTVTDRALRGRS